MTIHPTAIVDPLATVDASATVGPYVVIDGPVVIGPRTRLMAHVTVVGDTTLGADNVCFPGSHLGHAPQDVSWTGAPSGVRIGDRNVFRENSVVHRGSREGAYTTIGSDGFFMTNAHVAHDCRLADGVILATGATLGGHVEVGERAFISGNCVVHQYVRVGRLAIMRGLSRASRDVPPFAVMDETHVVRGINRVGLRRAGFDAMRVRAIVAAFRLLFRVRCNLRDAVARVEAELGASADVAELLAFVRASKRGVAMGPRTAAASGDEE
jgi:UDP-N-acetylglucosamine acyltransferase